MRFRIHSFSTTDKSLIAEYVQTVDGHRAVNLYGDSIAIDRYAKAFHPVVDGSLYVVSPRKNGIGDDKLPLYAAVEGPRNQTFGKFLVACARLGMQKSIAA